MKTASHRSSQHGVFLLEALIAILIFSLGVVGMMAMAGASVTAQSDAQYRTEAANLADQIASQIALKVDRTSTATLVASLANFSHQPTPADPTACAYSGAAALDPTVLALANEAGNLPAGAGLPGADTTRQQVLVETGTFNRVTITLCWKSPNDNAWRHLSLVSYVN
jgi:type IV pilus assembly protein PilV